MSKILLLGGTGAMEVYLKDILAQSGHGVFVTSRQMRESTLGNIHYIYGNAKDDIFLKETLETVAPDAIVDFMVYGTEQFRLRNELLLNGAGQYVFLSSYRVFAECVPLTEQSPRLLDVSKDEKYLATDEYGLAKARQEDVLRKSGHGNWTIVRPGITYSKERFQFGCLEANIVCARALAGIPVVMPSVMMDKRTTLTWWGGMSRE